MFDMFIADMRNDYRKVDKLQRKFPHAQIMRFNGTHFDMLKRAVSKAKTEYIWYVSSCCDYATFDFDWMPPPGQELQLHTWASGYQGEGDTFLVNVAEFKKQMFNKGRLSYYEDINYHKESLDRFPWPVVDIPSGLLVTAIQSYKFITPYVEFRADSTWSSETAYPSLWDNKAIVAVNKTGSVSYVPSEAKMAFKRQIYDWPYIQYLDSKKTLEKPLDVVFISYDEKNAESNWDALKKQCPRAKRVQGVSGMLNAIQAASKVAMSDYFYVVFGKTLVDPGFKFDYQPDRFRSVANHVFLAYNPLIDHTYGHAGVVLHHKSLINNLKIEDVRSQDITTLVDAVTVPILSCTSIMTDEWSAYRTAFREAYKLNYGLVHILHGKSKSIDDEYNLSKWLTCKPVGLGKWILRGAHDGRLMSQAASFDVNDWDLLQELFEQVKKEMYESTFIQA